MSQLQLYAVVLAAGASTRFGATKQLLPYAGVPLVLRAVRLAEQACKARSVLVLGHDWRRVADASQPLQGFFVCNARYRNGVATSIRSGLCAVAHAAGAILLLLADQPLVTAAHLRDLQRQWRSHPAQIIASRYDGVPGPPIIFPARLFEALKGLEGDRGARDVVAAERDRVRMVDFAPAAIDIDQPSDLAALEARERPPDV